MEQLKTTVVCYGDGIYALDQQMVRAFLLVGDREVLLLDTGAVRIDILPAIKEISGLPLTVVLTHGDGDHLGNLRDFPAAYINENDMAAVRSHEPCKGVRLLPLSEGDVFDIGGRRLRVLFTPGHTAGSVCLLDEENKLLFAGDTVSCGPVFMFGERRNMAEYRGSLKRLAQLRDDGLFSTVYCCHNTCPIPADTVDELISCVDGSLAQTLPGVPAPMPFPGGSKPLLRQYGRCAILTDGGEE